MAIEKNEVFIFCYFPPNVFEALLGCKDAKAWPPGLSKGLSSNWWIGIKAVLVEGGRFSSNFLVL